MQKYIVDLTENDERADLLERYIRSVSPFPTMEIKASDLGWFESPYISPNQLSLF